MPLVPIVIERSGREERAMDIYSRLLQDRIIILGTAIDDQVANIVVAQLLVTGPAGSARPTSTSASNSPGGKRHRRPCSGSTTSDAVRPGMPTWRNLPQTNG